MFSHDRPRMTAQEYLSYLDRAAVAHDALEVAQLRADALQRWAGDPWAVELADSLALHQERLALHEGRLQLTTAHVRSRGDSHTPPPAA